MSVSIMEVLQNADYNLRNNGGLGTMLAKEQLHNATVLLDKGYNIWTEFEPLHTFNSIVNSREEWYGGGGEKRKEKILQTNLQSKNKCSITANVLQLTEVAAYKNF